MNNFKDDEEKAKNLLKYGYERVVNLPMKEFDIDELEILREFCTIKRIPNTEKTTVSKWHGGWDVIYVDVIIDVELGVNWIGGDGRGFLEIFEKDKKVIFAIISNKQTREHIEKELDLGTKKKPGVVDKISKIITGASWC